MAKTNVPKHMKSEHARRGRASIEPTVYQEALAEVVAENLKLPPSKRVKTKAELMRRAGYSKGTIGSSSGKVFSSEGFQLALKRAGITEDRLTSVYTDAMQAKQTVTFKGEMSETDLPDHKMRVHAADKLADLLNVKKKTLQINKVSVDLDRDQVNDMLGI